MIGGRNSIVRIVAYNLGLAFLLLLMTGCSGDSTSRNEPAGSDEAERSPVTVPALSDMARAGEELFNANCSVCHGMAAAGTSQGPSLIDRIYHPGHHPDLSIRNAVRQGVQQHHWFFGDMPPVAGVLPDDVEKIICYVREMQRANGILEGNDYSSVC